MRFMPRHKIDTTGMERMTLADTFCAQCNPFKTTMAFYRFHTVSGTARIETAGLPKKRGQAYLVCADEQYENSPDWLEGHSVPLF